MATTSLRKITAANAAEICARFPVGAAATAIAHLPPAEFLDQLIVLRQFHDATRFLAHALPKREAVWWACVCARQAASGADGATAALAAAEAWVYQPTEDNRRAAMAVAQATGFTTPASWAAVGAFWSGGSMAPPEAPSVPPGEFLTSAAVAGAVLLAAVEREPEKSEDKFRAFIAAAIDIANGGNGRNEAMMGRHSL